MSMYCIIETEDGWTAVQQQPGTSAEAAAHRLGGTVIDPGPYESYADACEALDALGAELDEDETSSDVPGNNVPEGRFEWGE